MWDWYGFLSNLITTLAGVGLGVPLGLWLNRRAEAAAGQAQRAEIAHVLDILRTAVEDNRPKLERFGQELARGWTLYDTGLDTSTWEALQAALTADFRNPQLRRSLAHHFARTATVVKLNDMYVRFAVSIEGASGRATEAKQGLGTTLRKAVEELSQEASELVQAIPLARAQLLAVQSDSIPGGTTT